jgi:hypothetical protein
VAGTKNRILWWLEYAFVIKPKLFVMEKYHAYMIGVYLRRSNREHAIFKYFEIIKNKHCDSACDSCPLCQKTKVHPRHCRAMNNHELIVSMAQKEFVKLLGEQKAKEYIVERLL